MDKVQKKKTVTVCYTPSSRPYSVEFCNKVCIGIFTLLERRELTDSKNANNNLRELGNTVVDLVLKCSLRRPIRNVFIMASRCAFTEVISVML